MIKVSILIVFFNSGIFNTSDSTSFIKYHENINNAELLLYNDNLKESLESYIMAFNFLNPTTQDLVNAVTVASLNKNKKCGEFWLSKAFSRDLNIKVVTKRKIITQFLGRKRIREIYKKADRSKIDISLRKSIDSIIIIDQKNRSKKGVLDKTVDTQNASFLLNIIKTLGFPTEEKIGTGYSIDLLFRHNLSFWLSENNYEILKAELYKGNIPPELYALLREREQLFKTNYKERVYYLPYNYLGKNSRIKKGFSVIPIDNYVNTSLIPEIDNRRREISLSSVENSQKIYEKSFSKKYNLLVPMTL